MTHKQTEHPATNKDVDASNKRWGITQIAAICIALTTTGAFLTGFWSTAVEAGGKDHFATVKQVEALTRSVEALDAGAAKKEDVQDVKQQMTRVEGKLDRLIEIQLKQKGGK